MVSTRHKLERSFLAVLVLLSDSHIEAEAACSSDTCNGFDGNFCGQDDQCYFYTCDNFYQYGNWTSAPRISPLTCEEYDDGAEEHYNAIVYGCSGYGPGANPGDQIPRQVFNEKCLGLVDNLRFECYRMAAETNFTSFLTEVAALAPNSTCDNYDPERNLATNAVERFIYGIYLVETFGATSAFGGINTTTIFDEESAYKTMFAKIEVVEVPTNVPTLVPTTAPSPSPTPSSSAFSELCTAVSFLALIWWHT